jgi:hypothetical protein
MNANIQEDFTQRMNLLDRIVVSHGSFYDYMVKVTMCSIIYINYFYINYSSRKEFVDIIIVSNGIILCGRFTKL